MRTSCTAAQRSPARRNSHSLCVNLCLRLLLCCGSSPSTSLRPLPIAPSILSPCPFVPLRPPLPRPPHNQPPPVAHPPPARSMAATAHPTTRPLPTTEGNTQHTQHHPLRATHHTTLNADCIDLITTLCTVSAPRRGIYWLVLTAVLSMPALMYFHGTAGTEIPQGYTGLSKMQIHGKKKKDKEQSEEEQ